MRIDDVLVHPRDNELVLATHSRRVMVMDDITALRQFTPEVMETDAHLFEPREAVAWKQNRMRSRSVTGDKVLQGDNALPGTATHFITGWWMRRTRARCANPRPNGSPGSALCHFECPHVCNFARLATSGDVIGKPTCSQSIRSGMASGLSRRVVVRSIPATS